MVRISNISQSLDQNYIYFQQILADFPILQGIMCHINISIILILLLYFLNKYFMDKQCSYIDDYLVHGLLGDGGQASVYLCSKNKQFFAAKVYLPGASKADSFKRQVDFLKKLNYKHLINVVSENLQAKVKLPEKAQTVRPVLFLEFAEGGELFDYISKEGRFSAQICRSLFKMLINAIDYLNSVGVAHRDLKPENILFDKNYILKVSDFGLSTLTQGHDKDYVLYSKLGTQGYKPPEMEEGKYTGLQADLFAAGVILFVMFAGTPPFLSTKKTDKIYRMIREKAFAKFWALHEKKKPNFFPDSIKRLFNAFFSAQVEKRPTFQSLKQDEWLNGDEALQNDIYTEMMGRYKRILATDENKQKIEKAKVQMFESEMEQENGCCKQEMMEEQGEGQKRTRKQELNINFHRIDIQSLPKSQKHQLISTKVAPSVVVAWLENYISNAYTTKNVFMSESCFVIQPQVYKFNYNEQQKRVEINLNFKIIDEDETEENEQYEQLSIHGQLVQLKEGNISIEWQDARGNAFWLSSLIGELDSQLKVLV